MTGGAWTRRRLLAVASGSGALGLGWGLSAMDNRAKDDDQKSGGAKRTLQLKNLHTGEVLQVSFDRDAGPDAATLAKLQHLLRDYRVNEEHAMDPALYGLLVDVAEATGHEARYEVISGYRSPQTNQKLHDAGHGVAEHSQHMLGHAIDVRLQGCELTVLRDAALKAKRGGVGYYPSSNFVHIDTGRVRTWVGQ
jgi:uncharacterized protein YcbK (DUF882 family)